MQFDRLKRRAFITLLGGAAAGWPLGARTQQADRLRLVGALMGIAEGDPEGRVWVSALRKGLEEAGWVEGRNLRLDLRWPSGDTSLMRAQAAELVNQHPDVIVTHATPATIALRHETRAVPNVFVVVADPVGSGFVESFPRPGGNSTGFTNFEPTIGSKWLELLKEIAPAIERIAIVLNPETYPGGINGVHLRAVESAAVAFGIALHMMPFRNAAEVESGFGTLERDRIDGLVVLPDTSTTRYSDLIVALAARHRLPAMYPYRDFVNSGGLLCYGVDRADLYRRAASYVDRILRGAKPSGLAVQAPTKYELSINLKTAKALGLDVSPMLLARADEVIE
jgi:putative ABC transport system substrate-binding protein